MRDAGEGAQRLRDAASPIPTARAAAAAAAAFSRLCSPAIIGSAGSGSSKRELDPAGMPRDLAEAARDDRRVRFGLVLEDAELGIAVALERAVPVEVVGLEVEQHGDARPEARAMSSSWKLDSSQTIQASARPRRPGRSAARPTLPAT